MHITIGGRMKGGRRRFLEMVGWKGGLLEVVGWMGVGIIGGG